MPRILFTPEAEKEILDSFFWYENEREGLGQSFKLCLDAALSSISRNPNFSSFVYKKIRSAKMEKFPYTIMYRIVDEQIQIIAVFHQSRNPKIWKKRM